MKLEDFWPQTAHRGILPDAVVTVVSVQWQGPDARTLIYRGPSGGVAEEILYRHDEPRLTLVEEGRPWSFEATEHSSASSPKRTAFASPTSSHPSSPSAPLSSNRCRHPSSAKAVGERQAPFGVVLASGCVRPERPEAPPSYGESRCRLVRDAKFNRHTDESRSDLTLRARRRS